MSCWLSKETADPRPHVSGVNVWLTPLWKCPPGRVVQCKHMLLSGWNNPHPDQLGLWGQVEDWCVESSLSSKGQTSSNCYWHSYDWLSAGHVIAGRRAERQQIHGHESRFMLSCCFVQTAVIMKLLKVVQHPISFMRMWLHCSSNCLRFGYFY